MKDFTLSEAKKICKGHRTCGDCPLKIITQHGIGCLFWIMPRNWQNDIEPRFMVELPCKELIKYQCKPTWVVHYRDKKLGIYTMMFDSESEADAFLAELKGGKA